MKKLFSILAISLFIISANVNAWNLKSGDRIQIQSWGERYKHSNDDRIAKSIMYINSYGQCSSLGLGENADVWIIEKVGGDLGEQINYTDLVTFRTAVKPYKFLCRRADNLRTLTPKELRNEQKNFMFQIPNNESNEGAISASGNQITPVRLVLDSVDGLAGIAAMFSHLHSNGKVYGSLGLWKSDTWQIWKVQ